MTDPDRYRLLFDRPIALPLYLLWYRDDIPPWEPGEPDEHGNQWAGRVINWDQVRRGERAKQFDGDNRRTIPPQVPIPRDQLDNLCETDIVHIPCYHGLDFGPTEVPEPGGWRYCDTCGAEGSEGCLRSELAEFGIKEDVTYCPWPEGAEGHWFAPQIVEANLEAMREIAPRVQACLFGNLLSESAWADYRSPANHTDFCQWQMEIRAHRFMVAAATMVREAGGTPAFAPVPYEIRLDYAKGHSRIRNFFLELGALFLTFNGADILRDFDNGVKQQFPERWEKREGYPYRQFVDYFTPMNCISGMGFRKGLEAGNDQLAADHGIKAGLVGWGR